MRPTRRSLLLAGLTASAAAAPAQEVASAVAWSGASLNGEWRFRLAGERDWRTVSVPHTWQTEPGNDAYYGEAFYERDIDVPAEWRDAWVRVEFESVFHSAWVSVNGQPAGEHLRKGYTAFTLDLTPHLRFGQVNRLAVRVTNAFDDRMLPRGRSSDWTHDGGIYRPVRLLVTPRLFVERCEIESEADPAAKSATVRVRAVLRNTGPRAAAGAIDAGIREEETGRVASRNRQAANFSIAAGERAVIALAPIRIENARLWHFDHPHLYRLRLEIAGADPAEETFGVRRIEIRDGAFHLNGEVVRLMGVERMAGSNPEYGMAEPAAWIEHDHADMTNLNCVYTRVHWPQDRRVLEYCDRHGIFIQTEVPTWGSNTFRGMAAEPDADLLGNGLEQLEEMIARDRNHPCIFSWGVCNEVNGQNPPAASFARQMYAEAKRLDPGRLVTYASHSLRTNPGRDVAGQMDYVMDNEYYGSWQAGTPEDLARNLDEIHAAFPGKPIVISEYGWCACTADRPEGDASRAGILRTHDAVFRERPWVGGLIFFCYNDYRTHQGDQGAGVMKQRIHGVVDVYGERKPSYEVLRAEASPVESLEAAGKPPALEVRLRTRQTVPAYTLRGYTLRAVAHGFSGIPLERLAKALPELGPGGQFRHTFAFAQTGITRIQFDVLRPSGASAATAEWRY